ncbi:MAG: hypothetical protein CR977_03775 [Gammaproteobacteria bacterium]|nr:MAG: hypothetical protein CR977_03775 [Gammaproteobacteria bacterium]
MVKQWIKDYWLVAVGAVGLAIAGVYGINYYRQSQITALSDTAAQTAKVTQDLQANRLAEAETLTASLQNEQKDTSFSVIATLALAKKLFDEKKYTEAVRQYDWLIANAGDLAMRDIGRLRKARAQANAGQHDAAIDTLAGLEGQASLNEATLLKGDILLQAKQYAAAKSTYETLQGNETLNPQLIQQRLDLLNIKQQQSEQ